MTPTAGATGAPTGRSQTKSEKRSGNTLYQELAFHDTDAGLADGDDGADITGQCSRLTRGFRFIMYCSVTARSPAVLFLVAGSWVHPGEYASSGKRPTLTHVHSLLPYSCTVFIYRYFVLHPLSPIFSQFSIKYLTKEAT